jgi:hypothetical protein
MHLDNIICLRNNNVYLQKQAKTTYELERSSIYDGYLIVRAICVCSWICMKHISGTAEINPLKLS